MVTHLMVDLETLGGVPGSVIASIGAVKFDAEGAELGDQFYANVRLQSCLDAGLTVEGDTMQWWMEQPAEVRQALAQPDPLPLRTALAAFSEFYHGCEHIWAHGITFDLPILDAAYRAVGDARPWPWKHARDTRTLFSLIPQSVLETVPRGGIEHHALHDAIRQARMVQAAYRWLRSPRA